MAIGAIIGLFGSVSTNVFGWLNRKEDRKTLALELADRDKARTHEARLWAHEGEMLKLQSQAKVAETEQEAFLTEIKGSWEGLKQTTDQQTKTTVEASTWVKDAISLFRPVLTSALIGITIYASVQGLGTVTDAKALGIDVDKNLYDLIKDNAALATIYGLTEMSVTWWFGDRSIKRVVQNIENGNNLRAAGGAF